MKTTIKYDGEEYDLNDLGIAFNTVSFYCTPDDQEAESFFGTCDLTGIKGNIVPCMGIDRETGKVVTFEVLDSFVHGRLGKLAGAF